MSSKQINIFLTGASGYIGGSILTSLLRHSNVSNFKITTLIRGDESRVKKLASLGVTVLIGWNDSHDIIENAASESHVVIHTADSTANMPAVQSIIAGLNRRIQTTSQPAIYIHRSGAGIMGEDTRGEKGSTKVYSDLDPDQINNLPNENIVRKISLFIINAAQANPQLKTGIGTGLFNRTSVQLPLLIRTALKRGKLETVGSGYATWNNVHIADLVDGYIILLDELLVVYGSDATSDVKFNPYLTTGPEGYYFAENGHNSWRELAENIGKVFQKKGLIKSTDITSFPDNEVESVLMGPFSWFLLGNQTNGKADRLRKLSWHPHRPSLLDCFEEEVNAVMNEVKN